MTAKYVQEIEALLATLDASLLDCTPALSDPAATRQMAAQASADIPLPSDERVITENRMLRCSDGSGEFMVRLYRPRDAEGKLPVLVYYHGGAFIFGDPYQEEVRTLRYAAEVGCLVVSVDYRLAPEHPFPAGLNDCYDALCWTQQLADELGIDRTRIAVGGASAGGALAAAVALRARDQSGPALACQLLIYPVLDDRLRTPSMRAFSHTPIWNQRAARQSWQHYLQGRQADCYAAPARATELQGLAPAYVMTAEFDPLRDEAIEYTSRLMQAGVTTDLHNFAGTVHGFDMLAWGTPIAEQAMAEQVTYLQRAFAR